MNNTVYSIITRNAKGTVISPSVQNVYDENNLIRAEQIEPNTVFIISRFDLYTNRAVVSCIRNGRNFSALFDFDFLKKNCIINNIDKNQVIEAIYLPEKNESNKFKFKFTTYDVVMYSIGLFLLGIALGGILPCLF